MLSRCFSPVEYPPRGGGCVSHFSHFCALFSNFPKIYIFAHFLDFFQRIFLLFDTFFPYLPRFFSFFDQVCNCFAFFFEIFNFFETHIFHKIPSIILSLVPLLHDFRGISTFSWLFAHFFLRPGVSPPPDVPPHFCPEMEKILDPSDALPLSKILGVGRWNNAPRRQRHQGCNVAFLKGNSLGLDPAETNIHLHPCALWFFGA